MVMDLMDQYIYIDQIQSLSHPISVAAVAYEFDKSGGLAFRHISDVRTWK